MAGRRCAIPFPRAFRWRARCWPGKSLGSAVAIHVAAEQAALVQPVAAVVVEGAPSSVVDVAARRYPFAPVRTLIKDRFHSHAKVADIGAPLLLVDGKNDIVVPAVSARRSMVPVEPKEIRWIEGAGDNNLPHFAIDTTVMEFIVAISDRNPASVDEAAVPGPAQQYGSPASKCRRTEATDKPLAIW